MLSSVELRLAYPIDKTAIKRLCVECFPVRYPDTWYAEIVSSGRFMTILACLSQSDFEYLKEKYDIVDNIVGMVVTEYRSINNCKMSDRSIIHPRIASESVVMYILSLAVTRQYREYGIGSLLLSIVIDHARGQRGSLALINPTNHIQRPTCYGDHESIFLDQSLSAHQIEFVQGLRHQYRPQFPCRAVYLHTECTNHTALKFYKRRGFVLHRLIPRCYVINGRVADGYCCVLHCNDGYPYSSLMYPFCLHQFY
ncbi:unnamed protein product [Rodentolepis nana]|uniref:N-alpha-acetyltransferase 60 n=1 Tax=Rodentolepis nana TaxID=102285 RepID=A0A0R3T182_RODNA|nr:unnamed protein product [Rodentolepis nana]